MKRLVYMLLALVNLVLFLVTAIGATGLDIYLVRKEMAVIRRTGCGPTHCPNGSKAEFPIYGVGAVILGISPSYCFSSYTPVCVRYFRQNVRRSSNC
jgi:hypothetical protein